MEANLFDDLELIRGSFATSRYLTGGIRQLLWRPPQGHFILSELSVAICGRENWSFFLLSSCTVRGSNIAGFSIGPLDSGFMCINDYLGVLKQFQQRHQPL